MNTRYTTNDGLTFDPSIIENLYKYSEYVMSREKLKFTKYKGAIIEVEDAEFEEIKEII